MLEEFKHFIEEQNLLVGLHGIEFTKFETYKDKQDYLAYKNGTLKDVSKERIEEMEILTTLERLGYPMDVIGTFLFKNMISKIIKYLSDNEKTEDITELITQLRNHFSQFYIEIARIELDMGLKTFHNYVGTAMEEVDYSNADPTLLEQILNNSCSNMDYGDFAFLIASYIKTNSRSIEENSDNKEFVRLRKVLKTRN